MTPVHSFAISDGTCEFCRKGLQTSLVHGGFWPTVDDGAEGEAVRAALADGTLVRIPEGSSEAASAQINPRSSPAAETSGSSSESRRRSSSSSIGVPRSKIVKFASMDSIVDHHRSPTTWG